MSKDVVITLEFRLPPSSRSDEMFDGHGRLAIQPRGLALKSIDVIVPHDDLARFLKAGRSLERRRVAGVSGTVDRAKRWPTDVGRAFDGVGRDNMWRAADSLRDESSRWWQPGSRSGAAGDFPRPFMAALGQYMSHHIGLNIFHPGVRITRVACGGFVISEDRVKVFSPPSSPTAEDGGRKAMAEQTTVWSLVGDLVCRANGPYTALGGVLVGHDSWEGSMG